MDITLDNIRKIIVNNLPDIVIAVADIVIVAYIIYRILLLIRGTRAQQALYGLFLILIGFFASKFLELKTLYWILEHLFNSLLLIIIIVFQYDIRKGLSNVGKKTFMGGVRYKEDSFLIDELSKAVVRLAKEKLGSIILIECRADLSEIADGGTYIDANVSSSLLHQIFIKTGPLHDGAVIIQDARITTAGVFLPLTENSFLDPSLGTRHRAALGITEELDAVALIVSEERGQISIAKNGVLTKDINEVILRKMLEKLLGITNIKSKEIGL